MEIINKEKKNLKRNQKEIVELKMRITEIKIPLGIHKNSNRQI